MQAKDIFSLIEEEAPLQLQESYDNAGLQVGDPLQQVTGVVTTLDVTEATISTAISQGANLIVSHHPLLFHPARRIDPRNDYISRVIIEAIRHGVVIYSAHTNLDNAPRGVNFRLGQELGLLSTRPLVPLSSAQTSGLDPEFASRCGSGLIGEFPSAMSAADAVALIKQCIGADAVLANSGEFDMTRSVRTMAMCGGAGDDFIADAERQGADIYLTGEVSYHRFFGHPELLVLCGGHFETERHTSRLLADMIRQRCPELPVTIVPPSTPIRVF